MHRFLCSYSLTVLLIALTSSPVAADELQHADCAKAKPKEVSRQNYLEPNTKQVGWLTVPVFYITDRESKCKCFSQEQASGPANASLKFGLKNVIAPKTAYLATEDMKSVLAGLGWCEIPGLNLKYPTKEQVLATTPKYKTQGYSGFEEFATALSNYRLQAQKLSGENSGSNKKLRDEIVVLVHGCCQPFNYHMDHAAFLATWLKTPIVSYDWTAPNVGLLGGKITTYRMNEIYVQRNQDRFNEFLDQLETKFDPSKIVIIAHSMGNRLVEQAMLLRHAKKTDRKPFGELVFACADTDAVSFANHINEIIVNAKTTRIIQSQNDNLLRLSRRLHGRFSRLGSKDLVVDELLRPTAKKGSPTLQVIDVTKLDLGHNLPLWLISVVHKDQVGAQKYRRVAVDGLEVIETESGASKLNEKKKKAN